MVDGLIERNGKEYCPRRESCEYMLRPDSICYDGCVADGTQPVSDCSAGFIKSTLRQ
jgi:hypothetical protein